MSTLCFSSRPGEFGKFLRGLVEVLEVSFRRLGEELVKCSLRRVEVSTGAMVLEMNAFSRAALDAFAAPSPQSGYVGPPRHKFSGLRHRQVPLHLRGRMLPRGRLVERPLCLSLSTGFRVVLHDVDPVAPVPVFAVFYGDTYACADDLVDSHFRRMLINFDGGE